MRTKSRASSEERNREKELVCLVPFEFEGREVILARKDVPRRRRSTMIDVVTEYRLPNDTEQATAARMLRGLGLSHTRAVGQVYDNGPALKLVVPSKVPLGNNTHITFFLVFTSLRVFYHGRSGEQIRYVKIGYPGVLAREELRPKLRWIIPYILDRKPPPVEEFMCESW